MDPVCRYDHLAGEEGSGCGTWCFDKITNNAPSGVIIYFVSVKAGFGP